MLKEQKYSAIYTRVSQQNAFTSFAGSGINGVDKGAMGDGVPYRKGGRQKQMIQCIQTVYHSGDFRRCNLSTCSSWKAC